MFMLVCAGHVETLLFSTALSSVDVFGLPNALSRYVINASMFPSGIIELIWDVGVCMCLLACVICVLGVVIGILHNVVFKSIYPYAMSLLSLVTVTLSW